MIFKKLICLLLALILTALCFTGCRGKKEEEPVTEPEQTESVQAEPEEETEPAESESTEPALEQQTPEIPHVEVIDTLTDDPDGLEEEEELTIDIEEASELGGD